jgi:hypothetical protein
MGVAQDPLPACPTFWAAVLNAGVQSQPERLTMVHLVRLVNMFAALQTCLPASALDGDVS